MHFFRYLLFPFSFSFFFWLRKSIIFYFWFLSFFLSFFSTFFLTSLSLSHLQFFSYFSSLSTFFLPLYFLTSSFIHLSLSIFPSFPSLLPSHFHLSLTSKFIHSFPVPFVPIFPLFNLCLSTFFPSLPTFFLLSVLFSPHVLQCPIFSFPFSSLFSERDSTYSKHT